MALSHRCVTVFVRQSAGDRTASISAQSFASTADVYLCLLRLRRFFVPLGGGEVFKDAAGRLEGRRLSVCSDAARVALTGKMSSAQGFGATIVQRRVATTRSWVTFGSQRGKIRGLISIASALDLLLPLLSLHL